MIGNRRLFSSRLMTTQCAGRGFGDGKYELVKCSLPIGCWAERLLILLLISKTSYKAFRHVETLFGQGRNLYLTCLLLVGEK